MRTYAFLLKFINSLFIYLFYYIAFYESIPKTEKISLNFTFLSNSKHDLATNTLYKDPKKLFKSFFLVTV